MQISVVNYDDELETIDLLAAIRAVNIQIERDLLDLPRTFEPPWGRGSQEAQVGDARVEHRSGQRTAGARA